MVLFHLWMSVQPVHARFQVLSIFPAAGGGAAHVVLRDSSVRSASACACSSKFKLRPLRTSKTHEPLLWFSSISCSLAPHT